MLLSFPNSCLCFIFMAGTFLLSVLCDLPGDDMPDQAPSSCSSDDDCRNYYHSVCSGGVCTSCTSNSQCDHFWIPGSCVGNGRCAIPCTNDDQDVCREKRTICTTDWCQQCYADTDCVGYPGTIYCLWSDTELNLCANCRTNADCDTSAGMTCQFYKCVQCTIDDDCSGGTPYCLKKFEENICTECLNNGQCTSASSPKCSSDYSCSGCSDSDDCSHILGNPVCSSDTGTCVECTDNSDCTDRTKSYCYQTLNQCQSCSSDDQCSHIPNTNKCWYGECVKYSPVCTPTYIVTITQQKSLNDFLVDFDSNLVTKIDILSTIEIELVDVEKTDYTYSVAQVTNTQFKINFQVQKTIPQTTIEVEVPCPTQSGYVYGNITTDASTKTILFGSDELKAAVAMLGTAATAATATVGGISAAMIFLGANPVILWGLVGLLQTFYYMVFINVQYPVNVQAFFPIFAMGNLDFIPNPMWIIFPDIDNFSLPVPTKFAEQDVNGLFLANAGNMLLLWFGNIVLYLFTFLIMRYVRNKPKVMAIACLKIVETFEWSGTFRVFLTSYMELTIAAFLQLRVLSWSSGLFSASSVCGLIFGTFGFILPLITYMIVRRYHTNPQIVKLKFNTLIDGYDHKHHMNKYFTVISISRNLILAASLVYLHNYPYIEVMILTILSFSFAFLLIRYKPYENKIQNISNIISEFVFGVVHILILVLVNDDYSPSFSDEQRMDIGWVIMSGCGIILLASMILAILEQVSVLRNTINLLKMVLNKGKNSHGKRMKKLNKKIEKVNRQTKYIPDDSVPNLNLTHDMSFPSTKILYVANPQQINPNTGVPAKRRRTEK